MDAVFVEGVAAVVSGIVIFCGSVWLLLSVLMGPRLAYFISATVTLGFLLIMGIVWSLSPLGPIGTAPEWEPVAIGEEAADIDFGPIGEYPEGAWGAPDTGDDAEVARAAELATGATDYLAQEIDENNIGGYESEGDAAADPESTRLLEQDGTEYGAVTFAPVQGAEGSEVITVLEYNPGDPFGPPRTIAAGTLLLFLGHLFGLSRSERRARKNLAERNGTTTTTAT